MDNKLFNRKFLNRYSITYLLLGLAISLFLFNEVGRTILNKSSLNLNYNLLFLAIAVVTIYLFILNKCIDIATVILCIAITGFVFLSFSSGSVGLWQYIKFFISMTLPLLIIGFRLPEEEIKHFFPIFLKYFNVVIILLVLTGLIDYLSNAKIQIFLAQNHIFYKEHAALALKEHASGIYRYYSVLGHPLQNAWFVLIFYMLNMISSRYFKPLLNEYAVLIITVLGLLLCGSRTAFLIGLFLCLFLNNSRHKPLFIMLFLLICTGLFSTSLFQENLWYRFNSTNGGSLSGGRNEALAAVFNGFYKYPGLLFGGGLGYSRHFTLIMGFINSFEYPFIMLAYDLGVLSTLLFYLVVLVRPLFIFLKNKSYFIFAFFLMVSLYINGFNDIANYSDSVGQLCFIAMILINLSFVIKSRKEEHE